MSKKRSGRLQRASALVPLAALSVAWTASIAGVGSSAVVSASSVEDSLPSGTSVPAEAIEAPASVSTPDDSYQGNAQQIVASSSTNGIPTAALTAYQRAETVINAADTSCNLSWQLVAAIGRVESDHGRYGGNTLTEEGVATPGIYGIALNGKNDTAVIRDTDAGQFDNDAVFDRAIGPMQFIPSTWSVVGVDADGDGARNPQDIDDAALATAVYLCSGKDDLSTLTGQRSSVYRYNHSESYVDLVLSIMDAYLAGDYMSMPNGTAAAGYFFPDPDFDPAPAGGGKDEGPQSLEGGGTDPVEDQGPTAPPAPAPEEPDTDGGDDGGPVPNLPLPTPNLPLDPSLPPLPSTGVDPVDGVLTLAEAIVQCTLDGFIDNPGDTEDDFDQCVAEYTTKDD